MHTLRFLGLIAALVAGQPAPTPSAQPSTAAPVAVVANPSVDLGEAREGVTAVATFVIENHGTSDLIIEDVKPSCGCTTVELGEDERVIPPGGKRDIVARLDTTNRLGRQVKPITVKLNDPRSPEIKLTLTVNVVTLFQVLPAPIIQLRSVQRGRELTPLEVFPQHPNEVFTKLDIEVPKGLLDYRVESIENPERGKGKRYTFTVPDDAELGTVNDTIRIHGVIDGDEATVPVRVVGLITGDLVARPISLQSLTPIARGINLAPVTIASATDLPFHILRTEAGPYIDVRTDARQQNKVYGLLAKVGDNAPDGPLATDVLIYTDNTGQPILRIPLFVNVRPRYLLEPEMALLGPSFGNARRIRIRVNVNGNQRLDIRSVSCDHPAIAAEIVTDPKKDPENIGYVRIQVRDGADLSQDFTTDVVAQTNIPGAAEVHIPVAFYVAAP